MTSNGCSNRPPTLVEMGFTEFTLGINGPDWDVIIGADWLAWRDELNR